MEKHEKSAETEEEDTVQSDGMYMFRCIAKISSALIKSGENKAISLGLSGCTLFCKKVPDGEHATIASIKCALKDVNILEDLSKPEIFLNFSQSWNFFKYIAYYGFRLELIEIDILSKALKTMKHESTTAESKNVQVILF